MPYSVCDRVYALEPGRSGAGVKNVTFSEDYLAVHFPRFPVMPAAMMIDAVTEVAAAVLRAELQEGAETFLLCVSEAKFRRFVRPGDQLEIRVSSTARSDSDRTMEFVAHITVEGKRVASLGRVVLGWCTQSLPCQTAAS
jgi:3-hydroxyacyl-[acyl-carrier-protein] dehydratase